MDNAQRPSSRTAHGAVPCTSVYIVEDSASIRTRLVDMLDAIDGLSVVGEAESAGDAIAGILRSRPDAVVLDIQLAAGSGLDVLRQVHPLAPAIMFIVLTNHPNAQYRRSCMQAGASHFLDKSSEFDLIADLLSPAGAVRPDNGPEPHLNTLTLTSH